MKYELSSIKSNIERWVSDNFDNFTFRKNQLESIMSILNNILNNDYETTVVQAPTGTGKSLISIIAAGTLATYYDMNSYILASDLYLWNQYAKAIDKFKLKQFGYLKGSIGNYRCNISHTDFTIGKCRVNKVGLANLRNKIWRNSHGYSCADECLYMRHRFRAEKTPVTLLTYQLWLYQMNLVDHSDGTGFLPRKVIFCDECHNIPDIVEKYSQPVIDINADRDKIKQILEFGFENNVKCEWNSNIARPDSVHEYLDDATNGEMSNTQEISYMTSVKNVLDEYDYFIDCLQISEKYDANRMNVKFDIISDYMNVLSFVSNVAEACSELLIDKKSDIESETSSLTKSEKKDYLTMYKLVSWMHNYYSVLCEFYKAVKTVGSEYLVVEENKDRMTQNISYTFACVKEDYLCYVYLLKHSEYKVMLSATVGNKNAFADNIGVKYLEKDQLVRFLDIPNIFNFDKSPIYYIPTYKMSYNRKKFDYPKILDIVFRILNSPNFIDKHGMINTGSYENAKILFDSAPPEIQKRLCMYITAKDKNDTIEKFKAKKDRIIIGPSLVEGVDFPDDLCRFILILKIPYPNISSKTVKSKMNIFPLWYESTTSNTVIQNIGRGVRNENDYCITFILDGCFGSLFEATKEQYPIEIRNRIKVINS